MVIITKIHLQIVAMHPPQHQRRLNQILLGGSDNITTELGYEICIANHSSNYQICAKEIGGGGTQIVLTANNDKKNSV